MPAVILYGDSELIVKFMTRRAVPRRLHLAVRIAEAQELRRAIPVPTYVLHVPRERNEVADWLSKCGSLVPQFTPLAELLPEHDWGEVPAVKPDKVVAGLGGMVGATARRRVDGEPPDYPIPEGPCSVCGDPVGSLERHCSGCVHSTHLRCCGEIAFDPRPWFCPGCRHHATRSHTRDILLD